MDPIMIIENCKLHVKTIFVANLWLIQ